MTRILAACAVLVLLAGCGKESSPPPPVLTPEGKAFPDEPIGSWSTPVMVGVRRRSDGSVRRSWAPWQRVPEYALRPGEDLAMYVAGCRELVIPQDDRDEEARLEYGLPLRVRVRVPHGVQIPRDVYISLAFQWRGRGDTRRALWLHGSTLIAPEGWLARGLEEQGNRTGWRLSALDAWEVRVAGPRFEAQLRASVPGPYRVTCALHHVVESTGGGRRITRLERPQLLGYLDVVEGPGLQSFELTLPRALALRALANRR